VCGAAIANRDLREDDLQAGIGRSILREAREMEWGIASIGTIATIAPFIGLFGTVLGVLRAFWSIGEQGKTGSAVVAAGVAEALITTAAGLAIGILAVVAYNALTTWHGRFVEDLEIAGEDVARTISTLARTSARPTRGVP
jgi:biopolymer transport protein ExbB